MKSFQITSSAGVDLGTYPGAEPIDALNALARDAGYADHVAACEKTGAHPADWTDTPSTFRRMPVALLVAEVDATS